MSTLAQDLEPFNRARKDKKKKQNKDKGDSRKPRDSTTLATRVNMAKVSRSGKRKKKKTDINEIMCYNCNKKRYYSNKYLESRRSKN